MASTLLHAARERSSFGGKAGIWFRRKRRGEPTTKPPTNTHRRGGGGGTILFADGTDTEKNNETLQEDNKSQKKRGLGSTLIGWDDVRCRPVYSSESDSNNSTSYQRCGDYDDDSSEDEANVGQDSPNTVVHHDDLLVKDKVDNNNKRVRSYGRKRRVTVDSDHHQSTLEFMERLKAPSVAQQPKEVPEEETTDKNNTTKEDISDSISHPDENDNESSVFEFNEQNVAPVKKKHPETFHTPKGRVMAPSSTTSLSAARAFFRQLDNEQLNVTQEQGISPKRQRTIRTRTHRKVSLSDEHLSREYKEYSAACAASQVSPLSKQEFISNRGSYFRNTNMYDGFLDE